MKTLLCIFYTFLFSLPAHAALIPYSPELEAALNQLNSKKIAKVVYDVAGNGGSSTAHGLGVSLPANALIVRDYYYINTQFSQGDGNINGQLALSCETANNIFSAAKVNPWAANTLVDGVSSGASTAFKPITAQCEVTATPSVAPFTAGKLTLFIEYLLRD